MKPGLIPFPPGPGSLAVLRILSVWLAIGGAGPVARAGTWLLPSGLKPGETFQIAFVTDGTTDGESSTIADYNNFVAAAAAAAGLNVIDGQPVTWHAILSTPSVDAEVNAPQSAPVYDLAGRPITPDPGGLWATGRHFLLHPIDVTETGAVLGSGLTWTGTQVDGTAAPGLSLGANPGLIAVGDVTSTYASWISTAYLYSTRDLHVYALSNPITYVVPQAVPEPSAALLLIMGMVSLVAWVSIACRHRERARRGPEAA